MASAIRSPKVPYDLLRSIFEHLENDKKSLCVLSLASLVFRHEAQRTLFRQVMLKSYTAHIKFLCTVAASPTRLALLVRAYSHQWTSGDPTVEDLMTTLPDIGEGLRAMRCLQILDFMLPLTLQDCLRAYIPILSGCTFSLEHFDWRAIGQDVDELIDKVLPRQPTLKHLGLMCTAFMTDPQRLVPATTCPQLVSLSADWDMIKAFLPGRKVSTLSFAQRSSGITQMNIKSLATELKRIEVLSTPFHVLEETEAQDDGILQYFPSLKVLEIHGLNRDEEELFLQDLYMPLETYELDNLIPRVPTLQTLILSDPPLGQSLHEDTEFMDHLFAKFGRHLRYVDVQIYRRSRYARYTKFLDSGSAQKIAEEIILKLWS